MMGLYFRDLARTTALQKDADQSEVENYYHQAGGFYIQAGLMYPQDDENHICAYPDPHHVFCAPHA